MRKRELLVVVAAYGLWAVVIILNYLDWRRRRRPFLNPPKPPCSPCLRGETMTEEGYYKLEPMAQQRGEFCRPGVWLERLYRLPALPEVRRRCIVMVRFQPRWRNTRRQCRK